MSDPRQSPDPDRLSRIAAALPPDDAAWLVGQFAATAGARARLIERDEAVRAARRFWPDQSATAAARAMDHALADYLSRAWPRERNLADLGTSASAQRRALHKIARCNEGRALGYRQIFNLLNGTRGR